MHSSREFGKMMLAGGLYARHYAVRFPDEVAALNANTEHPAVSPDGKRIAYFYFDWSPDGKQLVFIRRLWPADLVLLRNFTPGKT